MKLWKYWLTFNCFTAVCVAAFCNFDASNWFAGLGGWIFGAIISYIYYRRQS